MPIRYSYTLFLQWLIVVIAVTFGFYLAWDFGLIKTLLDNDKSYISSLIIAIFLITTAFAGIRVVFLSRQLDHADQIDALLRQNCGNLSLSKQGEVLSGEQVLPSCLLSDQLFKQLMRQQCVSQDKGSRVMLENMERDLVANHDLGWLVADIMIKLGLLGTVIGFIMMLGSVAVIDNADITTIQNMLIEMSGGMRIALFTTLTGLLGGMLLGIQYHFLDRGAGRLVAIISDSIETYIGR